MLSAQKQQMPSDPPPENSRPPAATGFGKVLNSIQGLQQRLDDFSIEEVSRAHAKTHILIREINNLQAQLNALAKLTDVVFSVNAQIAAMPEDNFDLVGPDSLEKHPQLRAIVQAGKLIRMHRMLNAAQASADSSFDLPAGRPNGDALPNQTETLIDASPSLEQILQTLPVAETPLATSAGANTKIASEADPRSASLENSPVAHASKAPPTYDFADLRLEETSATVSHRKDATAPLNAGHKRASSRKGKPHIDQRLLSDLIETYGEFAISTRTVARAEAVKIPAPAAEPVASTSTDLVPFESTSAEPAFVNPAGRSELLGLPAPEQEREEPVFDGPSPSIKSRGEIDRQLKNIIKDYGAVDLYSHRKTLNVKTAVIAAAAGLALVVGGFFLFKAPSVPTPPAVEATAPGGNSAVEVHVPPSSAKQNLKR
jgi:hypothetical protein